MKKKVLAVILGAVMVASMAGCGGSDTKTTDTAATETTDSTDDAENTETAGTDDERKTEQKVVRLPFKIFFCRKPDNDICPAFLSLHQRKNSQTLNYAD